MRYSAVRVAGVLYVVAVVQFCIFELIAETLYSGYSVSGNLISDLGATCVNPPSTLHCVVHQPAATIFDSTVFLLGLMFLGGSILVFYGTQKKLYLASSAIAAAGTLLIGIFPENTGWTHLVLSNIAFVFTGLSLILAWTVARRGLIRYLTAALGVLTILIWLGAGLAGVPVAVMGAGGAERLLALCALLGVLALGGYFSGQDSPVSMS